MSLDKYFFNLSKKSWVYSFEQPSDIAAPVFGYKDNRDFSVVFLQSIGLTKVQIVPDILSVKIGLANAATFLTSATSGTVDNSAFPFVLPITGSAIDTFIALSAQPQKVDVEFKLTTSLGINRYKSFAFLSPQVNSDAVPDPAVVEPPITMSEAIGVFVQKRWPANFRMQMIDETTGEIREIYSSNRETKNDLLG